MERLLAHATRNYFETDDPLVRRRQFENGVLLNQQPAAPAVLQRSPVKPQNSVVKHGAATFWLRSFREVVREGSPGACPVAREVVPIERNHVQEPQALPDSYQ